VSNEKNTSPRLESFIVPQKRVIFSLQFPGEPMRKLQSLVILIGLVLNVSAYAQDGTSVVPVSAPAPEQKPATFGVSVQSNDFKYKEPGVMTQSGRMNGFDVFGLFNISEGISILGNLDYSTGKLEYDGALMNGTPVKSEDKYTVIDLAVAAKFYTEISFSAPISFSAGLGRRQTVDANDPSPSDYRREHVYNYLSLGAAIEVPFSSTDLTTFNLGLDTLYLEMLKRLFLMSTAAILIWIWLSRAAVLLIFLYVMLTNLISDKFLPA